MVANLQEFLTSNTDQANWRRVSWVCAGALISGMFILVVFILSLLDPISDGLLVDVLTYSIGVLVLAIFVLGSIRLIRQRNLAIQNGIASDIVDAILKQAIFTTGSVMVGGFGVWLTLLWIGIGICELNGIRWEMFFGINIFLGLLLVAVSLAASFSGAWLILGRRVFARYSQQIHPTSTR